MKKFIRITFLAFIIYKVFTCTSLQKNTNSDNEVKIEWVHSLLAEGDKITSEVLTKVKNNKSTTKVIKWYFIEAPMYKPSNAPIEITSVNQLEKLKKNSPEKIISLIITFDEKIDSSTNVIKLDSFKELEYLRINNTNYAPLDLTGLKNIKTLHFNRVYDLLELPKGIDDLESLEHLSIYGANKIKQFPKEIYHLTKLKTLQITGLGSYGYKITPDLKNLKEINYLDISSNIIIPKEIGTLKNLKELNIDNGSYETAFQEIYNLPNLEILGLRTYSESDLIGISALQNLKVLNLQANKLIPEIGSLSSLEGLIINYNNGSYPNELRNMDNLVSIQIISDNQITEAPNFIPYLKKLDYLEIRNCSKLSEFGQDYRQLEGVSLIQLIYNDSIKIIPKNLIHLKDRVIVKKK